MRRVVVLSFAVVSLLAAVLLAAGAARETTGERWAWPTPGPTQTPHVLTIHRTEWVVVTATSRPYVAPTETPERPYVFPTSTPDLSASGKMEID